VKYSYLAYGETVTTMSTSKSAKYCHLNITSRYITFIYHLNTKLTCNNNVKFYFLKHGQLNFNNIQYLISYGLIAVKLAKMLLYLNHDCIKRLGQRGYRVYFL